MEAWRSFLPNAVFPCGNGHTLSRCLVINNVLTGPQLRERLNTRFCNVEALRGDNLQGERVGWIPSRIEVDPDATCDSTASCSSRHLTSAGLKDEVLDGLTERP